MGGRLGVVLGASSAQGALALVVVQGAQGKAPIVSLRPKASSAAQSLSPSLLAAGPHISPFLRARDVQVYRVEVPLAGESVLEARSADGALRKRTSVFGPLPTSIRKPAGLTVALGSCLYHSRPYLQRLASRFGDGHGLGAAPAFALLVGDNVYLDVPKPGSSDEDGVVGRYLQYFLDDSYTALRSLFPAFTTYDDHELWNDYPRRALPVSLWLSEVERPAFESAALECLELFQRSINPQPSAGARYAYEIALDGLSFFVADTRSARLGPNDGTVMPAGDLDALEAWAKALKSPGVLVLGQPLWIEPIAYVGPARGDHNISHFKPDYARICAAVENAPHDVLVLSGDVHYSRMLSITPRNRRTFHEIVASPMISIPSMPSVLTQLVFGGSRDPDLEHEIDDTARPPRAGWNASYMMGTGSGTCFAMLSFKAAGKDVSVSVAFIDARTGQPARPIAASPLGRASVRARLSPQQFTCSARDVLVLRSRLSS
jgi:hypothetical protein